MVITKPTVASAQLLDPGWKLYPSNMLFMLNEYLYSNHADYLSSTPKSSKRKKFLLVGDFYSPLDLLYLFGYKPSYFYTN